MNWLKKCSIEWCVDSKKGGLALCSNQKIESSCPKHDLKLDAPADVSDEYTIDRRGGSILALDKVDLFLKDAHKSLHQLKEILIKSIEVDHSADGYEVKWKHFPARNLLSDREVLLIFAKLVYKQRRIREPFLGGDGLFGEPAWDIMVDLFIAELSGKSISVTSACIGACVPPTTALRWLAELESRGVIVKITDSIDKRRSFVKLSTKWVLQMESYFTEFLKDLGTALIAVRHSEWLANLFS